MKKISVIIPAYNVESLIGNCVRSVLDQDYQNLEIVCVDDGSADKTLQVLFGLAQDDSRVRVIHQENAGVSVARNHGLDCSTGDIVMFVDSDDRLDRNACKIVSDAFLDEEVDLVKFSAQVYPSKNSTPWLDYVLSLRPQEFTGFDKELIFNLPSRPFPWNGAYRKDFLDRYNLRFPENVTIGEDQVFSFMTLPRIRKARFLSEQLYIYNCSRDDSLMHTTGQDVIKKMGNHIDAVSHICSDWLSNGFYEKASYEFLQFIFEFAVSPIYFIEDCEQRNAILRDLSLILREHFDDEEIHEVLGDNALYAVFFQILNPSCDLSHFTSKEFYKLQVDMFGKRRSLKMFLENNYPKLIKLLSKRKS